MTLRPLVALILSWVLSLCGSSAAAGPFRLVSEKDGLRIERREVEASAMPEVRVTTHSPQPVSRIAAAIWSERPGTKLYRRYPRKRVVLRDDPAERVVYQRLTAPVVSERDYTVRMQRSGDGKSAPFQILFELDNGAGPPPVTGVVRLGKLRGSWTVTSAPGGGSDVVYSIHSEPGGNIPAFLVRSHYIESARELVVDVLEWADSHP